MGQIKQIYTLLVINPLIHYVSRRLLPRRNSRDNTAAATTKNQEQTWRMYYGNDHIGSLGSHGRYGERYIQSTAGKEVQHAKMFSLLHKERDNTLQPCQI